MAVTKRLSYLMILLCFTTYLRVSSASSDFSIETITKTIRACLRSVEKFDCLKRKAIERLDEEMQRNDTIYTIDDAITIRPDPNWDESNEIKIDDDVKGQDLNGVMVRKFDNFLRSRIIQMRLGAAVPSKEQGEGRKKGKNDSILMYGALGMASVIAQLFMGKMAMVAGMALLLSKISLILAISSGLRKMAHVESWAYQGEPYGAWPRSTKGLMTYRSFGSYDSTTTTPYDYEVENHNAP